MLSLIKKSVLKISRYFKWQIYVLKNYNSRPPIKVYRDDNGPKIHIGPGEIDIKGWINIDGRALDHVHLITDNLSLKEFADGEVSEIYMCHILEHLSFEEVNDTLKIFYSKLKIGGIIRISVPNFKIISEIYSNFDNIDLIKYPLMGGQDYSYNFHKSIYDFNSLKESLKITGYSEIELWDQQKDFGIEIGDWAAGKINTPKGKRYISLNVKAKRIL